MRRIFDDETSPETHRVIAAAIEVQSHFGTGLLESAYGDALEMEFLERGIPHEREVQLPVFYKGREIRTRYRADFICFGHLLVELKVSIGLGTVDFAQLLHYLRITE